MFSETIKKMIKYDAKKVASEWIDSVGTKDALVMVHITREIESNGDIIPEPAQQAKNKLLKYLSDSEIIFAWPIMLDFIERQIKLHVNNN